MGLIGGLDQHYLVCFAGPHPRETLWGPTPTAVSARFARADV
jgi:hypothetical protein